MAFQGSYVYVGLGARLAFLDISNPAHPVLAGRSGIVPGVVQGLAVAGNDA